MENRNTPLPFVYQRTRFQRVCQIVRLVVWSVIIGLTGLLAALLVWAGMAGSDHKERDRRDLTELQIVFAEAVADGTIKDPPVPASAFRITSRHRNTAHGISYTNSAGEEKRYLVTRGAATSSGWKDCWTFQREPATPYPAAIGPEIFTRERKAAP